MDWPDERQNITIQINHAENSEKTNVRTIFLNDVS